MRLQPIQICMFSAMLLIGGCAGLETRPQPMTAAEIVQMAKAGEAPPAIIDRLHQTDTVLRLSASDFVKLARDGVPGEVLDYLQAVLIAEIRRRDQFEHMMMYGPYSPFGPCPGGGRFPSWARSPLYPSWPYC